MARPVHSNAEHVGLKYLHVRDLLVHRFKKERYLPGRKLPTEQELSRSLGVSRTTIRQALKLLEDENIIVRRHGSGTFFAGRAGHAPGSEAANGLVGMVNFFFMDYIYPDILRGIEQTIFSEGYTLVLANSHQSEHQELLSVERLIDQGVKGLILEPSRNLQIRDDHPMVELLDTIDIPVVTTHWGIEHRRVSTVSIDDECAGYEATRYLIERGHRSVAIVYKKDVQAGYHRYIGYRHAMEEASLPLRDEWAAAYDNGMELEDPRQGYALTRRLLDGAQRPTAIFYFNDFNAIQGYRAIQEAGLTIPRDISVIGFDNYRSAELLYPPLTTFEHPKYRLGRWAARILVDEITEPSPRLPKKMVFEPILIERESVAPPPT